MSDDPGDTPKKEELPGGEGDFSLDPSSDASPGAGGDDGEFMSFEEFSQLDDDSPVEAPLDSGEGGAVEDASFTDLDTGFDASFDESELEEFASFDEPEVLDFDEDLDMDIPDTPPEALEGLDEVPADSVAAPDSIGSDLGESAVPEMDLPSTDLQEDDSANSLDEGLSVDPGLDLDSNDSLDDEDWDSDLDEDWDQGEDDEETFGEKKNKKAAKEKKPIELSFNTIVIGGGVVLGVGVLAFQILTAQPTVQREETIQSALTMTGAIGNPVLGERGPGEETPQQNAETSNAGVGQGFLNNPEALKQAQQQARGSETSPSLAPNSSGGTPSQERPATRNIPPQPTPMTADSGVPTETIARNNSGQRLAVRDTSQQTASVPVNSKALEKLSNQLETLSGEMDKVSKRIGSLENKVSTLNRPTSNASQQDNAAIEQMRQSLSSLRNQVGSLETNVARISSEQSSSNRQSAVSQNSAPSSSGQDFSHGNTGHGSDSAAPSVSRQQNTVAAVPRTPGLKPKSWETIIPSAAAPAQVGGGVSVGSLVKWRLRSAQPGRAWVSRLGDNAITMIRVGNTLPGVGRITAINSVNGRWVVRGEQAVITQ